MSRRRFVRRYTSPKSVIARDMRCEPAPRRSRQAFPADGSSALPGAGASMVNPRGTERDPPRAGSAVGPENYSERPRHILQLPEKTHLYKAALRLEQFADALMAFDRLGGSAARRTLAR